ncbi:MAG: cupin domain-containing protein [Clostridia bacterium]|nr:cupin domain-containing protein [Clostridia bacterium]
MITRKQEIRGENDASQKGLTLHRLAAAPDKPEKVRMYARAILAPGGEVYYHKHEGESESYYILSGRGIYSDNGVESEVLPGDITFTPSGKSHGIKNAGDEDLHFMALIILD